jgi:hypothetical protein
MLFSIPQLSGAIEYARQMDDTVVVDWLASGGTVGLGENPLTAVRRGAIPRRAPFSKTGLCGEAR